MPSNIQMAKLLGWTSLAIGVTEIAATKWVQQQMGVKDHDKLLRAFGVREIAAGATILTQPGLNQTVAAGLWSRVAGDVLDLAMLGLARKETRNPRGWSTITGIVLAATGLDLLVATCVQRTLTQVTRKSEAARLRVKPKNANPKGVTTEDGTPATHFVAY